MDKTPSKGPATGTIIYIVMLLTCFGTAGYLGWQQNAFMQTATRTEAEIVASGGSRTAPTFSFTDTTGKTFEVKNKTASSDYQRWDRVQIAYDPQNPEHAYIIDTWQIYGSAIIAAILGGFLALPGLLIFFITKHNARKNAEILAKTGSMPAQPITSEKGYPHRIKFTEKTTNKAVYIFCFVATIIAIGLFIGTWTEYQDGHTGKSILYGIIGILVGLLGIGGIIGNYQTSKMIKELRETGTQIQAELVGVKKEWQSGGKYSGGHYTYDLSTKWKNPADGKEYTFTRYGLIEDPNPWLKTQKTIKVLVDLQNLKRHYIEVPNEFKEEKN